MCRTEELATLLVLALCGLIVLMLSSSPRVLELQHLGYRHMAPHPALRSWVQGYWAIEQTHIPPGGFVERTYPDGGTSLCFRFPSGADEPAVTALLTQSLQRGTLASRSALFGVRFLPGGAFRLLGLPPAPPGTPPLDHSELGLPELSSLHAQLAEAQPERRATLVDQWLLERAAKLDLRPGLIQHLWPRLVESGDLAQLYEQAGLSRRSFERRFHQEVGLSPGQLRQLLRLRRARYLIKRAPTQPLVEVAYASGYFDQAHFIRHFRALVEETPGQYRERQLQRLRKGELVLA